MSWENWKARYEARQAQIRQAVETPGTPVPGTGRRRHRWHRSGRHLQPYARPRKGGGKHGDYEGRTGPLE